MFSFSQQFDFIYAVRSNKQKRIVVDISRMTRMQKPEGREKNIAKCKMLHTHCFKFSKDIFSAIANVYLSFIRVDVGDFI